MWMQDEYQGFEGKWWSLPPRKILPKPYHKPHPAMWYAAGNTSSYAMAAQKGLGVLGFSVGSFEALGPVVKAYKDNIGQRRAGRGLRQRQHHGHHRGLRGRDRRGGPGRPAGPPLLLPGESNVYRYHDTFPHPPEIPMWPDLIPDFTNEIIDYSISQGGIIGTPDHALEQCRRWEALGADQIVVRHRDGHHRAVAEMIRLMGEYVIPKIDTDPVHRSTRMRDAAAKTLA